MGLLHTITTSVVRRNDAANSIAARMSQALLAAARGEGEQALQAQQSSQAGLTAGEAAARLEQHGPNEAVHEKRLTGLERLAGNVRNPLVILLAVLGAISLATGDLKATIMMATMVVLGVMLRYFQEARADAAAEELQAMVSTTATVIRDGRKQEIPLRDLVPGDVVSLAAGDMVPADVRLLAAKDLFVSQAALTGEALPVEKTASPETRPLHNPLEAASLCFMGTNVEIGAATAVVLSTGSETYFGSLARSVVARQVVTSFDVGINQFTWLMIGFMGVMVPAVFFINGLSKGNWLEAFLFALAVAVGLTPEMLPMIVTVNLSKGAILMSRKKVIVKRLNAIQNFGAMDVLCTDKTGTITIGRVVLERHLDIHGDDSDEVLDYAFLNSYYQTGLKNMLDVAVLEHREVQADLQPETAYRKIDEIPFDFVRRRLSVVVHEQGDGHLLICKGAVEELLGLCTAVQDGDRAVPLDEGQRREALGLVQRLNEDGFRVLALGLKRLPAEDRLYSVADEGELALLGFLAFLDPAKETAQQVRGVALHADADHPRDPHEQDPVHPEPGQPPYSIACAEEKGRPSKWVTPRALRVLSAPPGPGNGVRRSPGRAPSMVPGCGSAAARRCVIRA